MGIFHEDRSDDDIASFGRLTLLAHLGVLEQDVLVQFDPALQNAQEEVERVVGQRRLDHVQQRLVLDEPLLDLVLFERQLALVRRRNGRRPVGHGATDHFLVSQVQLLQFGQGHFVRLDDAVELDLESVVQVH